MVTRLLWRLRQLLQSSKTQQQVQAVRDRLVAATRPRAAIWRTTVQANDGTVFRFDSQFPMHAGDLVEAQGDGIMHVANLLSSNRIVGVVVACTTDFTQGAYDHR